MSNIDMNSATMEVIGAPSPSKIDVRATAVIRYLAISNSQSPSFSFSLSVMLQIYNLILNTANGLLYFFYCQRLVTVIYDRRTVGDEDNCFVVSRKDVVQQLAFGVGVERARCLVEQHH